jgi:hypothetical protein
MEAGCFHFLGFSRGENPMPKSGMDAVALGRHGGRLFPMLEFARSANSEGEKRHGWPAGMPAVSNVGVCAERKLRRRETAWMAGRDAGCFYFLGFLRSKNPQLKNGTEAVFEQRKG